jgi:hypothetical protein
MKNLVIPCFLCQMKSRELTQRRKVYTVMQGHGHWRDGKTDMEMIAWNRLARSVIADETIIVTGYGRIMELAKKAGFEDAHRYLSEIEGLSLSEIESDNELCVMRDEYDNWQENRYFSHIDRSEMNLLGECTDEQRQGIKEVCNLARSAYEVGRNASIAASENYTTLSK